MLFDWLRRLAPGAGPDPERLAAVTWREFSPAVFEWTGAGQSMHFSVQMACLKVAHGIASVELTVIDHGLRIVCVIEGGQEAATLYLGNWFLVPPHLRRQGLASAVLLACIDAFQHAAFGRSLPAQQVYLEGFFVGDGAFFATAACGGVLPEKANAALVDLQRMKQACGALQMLEGPKPTETASPAPASLSQVAP